MSACQVAMGDPGCHGQQLMELLEGEQTLAEKHTQLRTARVPTTPLGEIFLSSGFETFGGFVVMFNFIIMTIETHARALEDSFVMNGVRVVNMVLLLYYTSELVGRMMVLKCDFWF